MGQSYSRYTGLIALVVIAGVLAGVLPARQAYTKDRPDFEPQLDASNHRLAGGDFLLAQVFDGKSQTDYYPQVDGAGKIQLPLVGSVYIAGLTPQEAAELLTTEYRYYYLQPYVSLQLLDYGKFEVFVFGPDFPGGIYRLDNGTRLLDVLTLLEIAARGTYRRVHVIRGDFDFSPLISAAAGAPPISSHENTLAIPSPSTVSRTYSSIAAQINWRAWINVRKNDPASQVLVIDPLSITVEGEFSANNIVIEPNDVIYIPTPERFVEFAGGVAKLGRYELLEEETLGDMLRLTGAPDYYADLPNVVITRFNDYGQVERLIVNLLPALDDPSYIADFKLHNRDQINIAPKETRIFILGNVNLPGVFDYMEDSTVLDYIAKAGGETPAAHLSWIAIIRQSRDRIGWDKAAEVIQVNFKEIHKGLPNCTDISLLPGDVIYVPPKGYRFDIPQIIGTISGAVTSYAVAYDVANGNSSSPTSSKSTSGTQ